MLLISLPLKWLWWKKKTRENCWAFTPRNLKAYEVSVSKGSSHTYIHAAISSVKYRHSPLVQGGLEQSCKIFVSMPLIVFNENLISRYKSLVTSLYVEPSKEAKLAALKEKNIKLIFRLKAQRQVFKQNLKESHNRASNETLNLMGVVFKGTKTSKREQKEKNSKICNWFEWLEKYTPVTTLIIEISYFRVKIFAVGVKNNFAVGPYEKFRGN